MSRELVFTLTPLNNSGLAQSFLAVNPTDLMDAALLTLDIMGWPGPCWLEVFTPDHSSRWVTDVDGSTPERAAESLDDTSLFKRAGEVARSRTRPVGGKRGNLVPYEGPADDGPPGWMVVPDEESV